MAHFIKWILQMLRFKWRLLMLLKMHLKKPSLKFYNPLWHVDVEVPENYMGDVIGDINSRKGKIESMDDNTMYKENCF